MSDFEIQWDTEDRHELMSQEVRIRENQMYMPSGLVSAMERTWNCLLTHVKTSTDTKTSEVTIGRADPKEPGTVQVRRIGAQNNAVVNFWRPLQKLKLRIPANRQFLVDPITRELPGVGTVFVLPMKDRVSVPRNLKEESEEEAKAAKQANGAKAVKGAGETAGVPEAETGVSSAKAESAAADGDVE